MWDCEKKWMIRKLIKKVGKVIKDKLEIMKCVEKEEMRGKKMNELKVNK